MTRRSTNLTIWLTVAVVVAAVALPLAGPLRTAWRCYRLHDAGVRETAEVLHKLENGSFALYIVDGPHSGHSCTAGTSAAIFAATQVGDSLEVVYPEWTPGECQLSTTIEASGRLLGLIGAALFALLAGLVAGAVALQRTFTRPAWPDRRIAADPGDVHCPACGKRMDEGYVPLVAGLHWRKLGDPVGLPHALGGLQGTVGWRGRPRLHAFRCVPCEILTVQYGAGPGR